ncbi:polymerase [Vallitalea longa]|uniref:Polymerase n=1 Tax=Vallitalea longa TaxID=2936439 RepID=A0A9W5Y885_9FIRM|nr:FapA family protein [Vallitalea longa]GKX28957.1 polymerase [Vallitalea longa]
MDTIYDGYFILSNKEDGLYIKLFPSKNKGKDIELNDVLFALENNNITDYDKDLIIDKLRDLEEVCDFKISDSNVEAADETMDINVSMDKLYVYIRFSPPVGDGKKLTSEAIVKELQGRNIEFGIDYEKIDLIVKNKKYNRDIIVARGLKPVKGKDGEIEYLFETQKKIKPHMNKDGTVDYHKLNLITNVKDGDALARLIKEEEGIAGKNVYGQEVPPPKVKAKKLYFGKNTKVRDNTLYAIKDGQVKIDDGKVIVLDYLEIPGNVDNSTGDIDFFGTVLIRGNVLTGYNVKAKGDVEVSGVVEGAHIIADGNIVLHRGIQGMDRGIIEAKGNVMAKYIENSKVTAGGCIHSDAILHSDVSCKGNILVDGKKGLISGGTVRSGIEVSAKVIGSHMGTVTVIDVGIDPTYIDEYNELQKNIKQLTKEEVKLSQIITLLNKKKRISGELSKEKKEMLISATRSKIFVNNKLTSYQKKYNEMVDNIDNKNTGKVKVIGNIYPGVRVSIGNVKYYVRKDIKYCVLYQDGADIKIASYS